MKECTYIVQDALGIHARPAGQLARLAKNYASCVTLAHGESQCDLKHLMALMALGIKQNDSVTVRAEGTDEDACIEEISKFLQENV